MNRNSGYRIMKYADYTINDFLEDNDFRAWVQNPTAGSTALWEHFLQEHPQKAQEVAQARQLLAALNEQVASGFTTAEHQQHILQRIKAGMDAEPERPLRRLPIWPYWTAAASVVVLLGLWFFDKPRQKAFSYEANVADARERLIEKVNNGGTPMAILFADGSRVRLAPNSRLSFPEHFNEGDKREVYLSGEAFFEVARNPQRPFWVYSNELVTKVLGTSFNIRAYDVDKDVVVNVTSGKVAVSVAQNAGSKDDGKVRDLLLLPNQQATLSRRDAELVRSLVKEPVPVKANTTENQFVFTKTRVPDVFEALNAAYSVPIVYDPATFAQCELTADLTAESLYEKLDVICKSIEATYRSEDGQIVISGHGCN